MSVHLRQPSELTVAPPLPLREDLEKYTKTVGKAFGNLLEMRSFDLEPQTISEALLAAHGTAEFWGTIS